MIVVSDTSPLISLLAINRLDLLKDLFGTVWIPHAVYRELTASPKYADEAEIIDRSPYIQVVEARDLDLVRSLRADLDIGESEAIALAIGSSASRLIIDELKGRAAAQKMGIPIIGTVGILIQAYKNRILTKEDIDRAVDDLKNSRRYIDLRLFSQLFSSVAKYHEDR